MLPPNLVAICGIAFLTVFLVLTFLAAVMRALLAVYPGTEDHPETIDASVVTAITSAVTEAFPGSRVTRIEELK
jgi:Na+-transporting methylmalonyl-CoA/oxaloacetate decarboxylase gamma subunit